MVLTSVGFSSAAVSLSFAVFVVLVSFVEEKKMFFVPGSGFQSKCAVGRVVAEEPAASNSGTRIKNCSKKDEDIFAPITGRETIADIKDAAQQNILAGLLISFV